MYFLWSSQEKGQISLIEQKELYTSNSNPNQDFLNPHKDKQFLSRLTDAANLCGNAKGKEPIVKKLKEANLSESAIYSYLEGREQGLFELPGHIKQVLSPNKVQAFKDGSLFKQLEGEASPIISPPLDLASAIESPPQSSAVSPTFTSLSTLSSASEMLSANVSVGELSSNVSVGELSSNVFFGECDVLPSTLLLQPNQVYCDKIPPSKRPNLDHRNQATTAFVPTAHVKPILRQTSRQSKFPRQTQCSEANVHAPPDLTFGNNPSADLKQNFNSNVIRQLPSDSWSGINPPNSFVAMPASDAISNLFGPAASELLTPAFVGVSTVLPDFQNQGIFRNNQNSFSGATVPATLGTNFHSQNGDPILDNLLNEIGESEMADLASSSNGFCHTTSSNGYKTADPAMYSSSSKDFNSGACASNGTNTELVEILSQFS